MKALFIKYPQNVTRYQMHRNTGGWKFIDNVEDFEEAWNIVNRREEPFIDDNTQAMTSDSGALIWEQGDEHFDFGDYIYHLVDIDDMDGNQVEAVKDEEPWNMDEILNRAL